MAGLSRLTSGRLTAWPNPPPALALMHRYRCVLFWRCCCRRLGFKAWHCKSGPQTTRYPCHLQDPAGDFLDRTMRGVDMWHTKAGVQTFGRAQFVLHLLRRGVTALGAPHLANLLQP